MVGEKLHLITVLYNILVIKFVSELFVLEVVCYVLAPARRNSHQYLRRK